MTTETLSKNWGAKFDFEIKTETRSFDLVDAAAVKYGIKAKNMPEKPGKSTAISRSINYLMRVCAASIDFPTGSKWATWEDLDGMTRFGRNPNYSLKITAVKQARTDAGMMWRINIANRNKAGENLGHVLNVGYSFGYGVYFTAGMDGQAFASFGQDMQTIVQAAYARFLTNYNDEDMRRILDAEVEDLHALKIIKKTNCFIPRDYVESGKKLYAFAKECGQVVSWLGLDNSDLTRQSLLADLKTTIFNDMDEYEAILDAKLNAPEGDRKRGEAQRLRMYGTANENIDKIMSQAEYHATVLGVMAEGIRERRDALKNKAAEFLTRDFSMNTPKQQQGPAIVVNPEEAF